MTALLPYPANLRIGDDYAKAVYLDGEKIWYPIRPAAADCSGDGVLSATTRPTSTCLAVLFGSGTLSVQMAGYGPDERMLNDSLPANLYQGDYTLSVPFMPAVPGRITHIRCYQEGGTHKYSLWDTNTGTKLASVTDTSTGPLAWRQVALPIPFNVVAGTSYTVSASVDGLQYGWSSWPGTGSLAPHLTMLWPSYYGIGSDVFPTVNNAPNHNHVDVVYQQLL